MKEIVYLPVPEYLRVLLRFFNWEAECDRKCWAGGAPLFGGEKLCVHPLVALQETGCEWRFTATSRMGIVVIAADPDLPFAIDEHGCFLEAGA